MLNAVNSIPAYVRYSDVFVILVPLQVHRNTGKAMNYYSWKTRGWCRVEFMCRLLCDKEGASKIFKVCSGSNFEYVKVGEVLPPGLGDFTVEGDRLVVVDIMSKLVDRRIEFERRKALSGTQGFAQLRNEIAKRQYSLLVRTSESQRKQPTAPDSLSELATEKAVEDFLAEYRFSSLVDAGDKGIVPLWRAILSLLIRS